MSGDWDFRIRAFATGFAGRSAGGHYARDDISWGSLLGETLHKGEASAAVEVEAWQARMRKGEVYRAELIDMRPGGTLTNLDIHSETKIPWSWLSIERLRQAI